MRSPRLPPNTRGPEQGPPSRCPTPTPIPSHGQGRAIVGLGGFDRSSRPSLTPRPPLHKSPASGTRPPARGCPQRPGFEPSLGAPASTHSTHHPSPGGMRSPLAKGSLTFPRAPHVCWRASAGLGEEGEAPVKDSLSSRSSPTTAGAASAESSARTRPATLLASAGPGQGQAPACSPDLSGCSPHLTPRPPGRGGPSLPSTRRAMLSARAATRSSCRLTAAPRRAAPPPPLVPPSSGEVSSGRGGAAGAGRKTFAKPWPRLIGPGRLRSFA